MEGNIEQLFEQESHENSHTSPSGACVFATECYYIP